MPSSRARQSAGGADQQPHDTRRLAEAHNLTLIALAHHDSLSAIPHAYTDNRSREGEQVTIQRPVHVANQVADFFISCGEAEAIKNTADHLKSFWDPRMRRQTEAHLAEKAGAGRSHIALDAVKVMVAKDAAARKSA
jgi:formate dehydrogenase subunit delta